MEHQLAEIPLGKIRPERELPADVYVKVGDKHIRFKFKGDAISSEKYDIFLAKRMGFLYVNKTDLNAFNDWLAEVKNEDISKLVSRVGEENRDIANTTYEMRERINNDFATEDLKEASVRIMLDETQKLVKLLSDKKKNKQAMLSLASYGQALADHSVSVASISVFLAMNLGQQHSLILQNIYMGGIYHDYGKLKISLKVLENKNSPSYVNAMNVHATMGMKALEKMNFLPKQILTIVEEHHEQFNGAGVPNGKSGDEIYGLTKIVSIANHFDNIVSEDKFKKSEKGIFHRALKILEMDNGKMFDPKVLEPSLEALREAIKNAPAKLFD